MNREENSLSGRLGALGIAEGVTPGEYVDGRGIVALETCWAVMLANGTAVGFVDMRETEI